MPTDVGFKARSSTASDAVEFHADQVTIDTVTALLERVKMVFGDPGSGQDVSAAHPLPVIDAAGETSLAAILAKLTADPATQTTLAAVLAKLNGTLAVTSAAAGDVASTLADGRKTVTTAGTPVALVASATPCKWVTVTALTTNTGVVAVGGSGVVAASGTQTGTALNAGDTVTIPVADARTVFVDARVSGEGVSFTIGS